MATTTISPVHEHVAKGVIKVTWSGVGVVSTSTTVIYGAASLPQYPDKTVECRGNFLSAGLSIRVCSIATGVYNTLNDSRGEGNALTFTAADTKVCLENPLFIKPTVSTATANTNRSITITIMGYSNRR